MAARAALGLPLFHAGDAALPEGQGFRAVVGRNGELLARDLVEAAPAGLATVQAAPPPSEAPRPCRASVLALRGDPAYRAREAERKRRERARRRREREAELEARTA